MWQIRLFSVSSTYSQSGSSFDLFSGLVKVPDSVVMQLMLYKTEVIHEEPQEDGIQATTSSK